MAPNFSFCFHFNYLTADFFQNCLFGTEFVRVPEMLRMIGWNMPWVRTQYFNLAFERVNCDVGFSRSSRHKTTSRDAYVEKVKERKKKKKLDGLRVSLENEMRCEAHCSSSAFEPNIRYYRICFETRNIVSVEFLLVFKPVFRFLNVHRIRWRVFKKILRRRHYKNHHYENSMKAYHFFVQEHFSLID